MKNPARLFAATFLLCIVFNGLAQCTNCSKSVSLNSGLVACYPLDGTSTDMISAANNGIVTNTVATTNRFGRANAAFQFNTNVSALVGAGIYFVQIVDSLGHTIETRKIIIR